MRLLKALLFVCLAALPAVAQAPIANFQFLDNNGVPVAGGLVSTYAAGTMTPLSTYTDSAAATPNANPIVLDSLGRTSIWIQGHAYKIVLQTALAVQLWSADNLTGAAFFHIKHLKYLADSSLPPFNILVNGAVPGNAVSRTVQAKASEAVSVLDFGAIGDGAADNSMALQAAMNAAGSSYTLLVPAGTYKFSSTLHPPASFPGFRLKCQPGAVLNYSGSGAAIYTANLWNFKMRGCTLVNVGSGTVGVDIPFATGSVSVYGYVIENSRIDNFSTAEIRSQGLFGSSIRNNILTCTGAAAGYLDTAVGAVQMDISYNQFEGLSSGGTGVVLPGDGNIVGNNFWFNTADDTTIGVRGCIHCEILGNHFEGAAGNQHGTAIYIGGTAAPGYQWKDVNIRSNWGFYITQGIVVDTPDSSARRNSVRISGNEMGSNSYQLSVLYANTYLPRVYCYDRLMATGLNDPNGRVTFSDWTLASDTLDFTLDNLSNTATLSAPRNKASVTEVVRASSVNGTAQFSAVGTGATGFLLGGGWSGLAGTGSHGNYPFWFFMNDRHAGQIAVNKRWLIDPSSSPATGIAELHIRSDGAVTQILQNGVGQVNDAQEIWDSTGAFMAGTGPDGRMKQNGVVFANLGLALGHQAVWCNDCAVATPCAGSGSGAWAFTVAGNSWKCAF